MSAIAGHSRRHRSGGRVHRGAGDLRPAARADGYQGAQQAAQEEGRLQEEAEGHQAAQEDTQKQVGLWSLA